MNELAPRFRLTIPKGLKNWHFRLPDGRLRSTGESDKGLAHLRATEILDREFGKQVRSSGSLLLTISDICEAYSEVLRIKNPDTHKRKWKTLYQRLSHAIGHHVLTDFSRDDCTSYTESRAFAGASTSTVRQEVAMLRQAWTWARRENRALIDCPDFELPPETPPSDVWLTKEEARALMNAATKLYEKLFVKLGFVTGARHSAILELEWSRVDLKSGILDFYKPKFDERGRPIAMKGRAKVKINDAEALSLLRQAYEVRETGYVIELHGKQLKSMNKSFKSMVARAGIRSDATPHCMRHSSATWQAMGGVNLYEIAKFLGHADDAMVKKVYGHHHPDFMHESANAVSF